MHLNRHLQVNSSNNDTSSSLFHTLSLTYQKYLNYNSKTKTKKRQVTKQVLVPGLLLELLYSS